MKNRFLTMLIVVLPGLITFLIVLAVLKDGHAEIKPCECLCGERK